jgi:hypothetical protein
MTINYDRGRKRVRQNLGTIDTYDFEGEFGKVINDMLDTYGQYRKHLEEASEIVERSGYGQCKYLDGVDKKTVKFDKLFLDWQETYDDEKQLCIIGERDMDAAEIAAMEDENKQYQEREKEQLRKLKEKYPDA